MTNVKASPVMSTGNSGGFVAQKTAKSQAALGQGALSAVEAMAIEVSKLAAKRRALREQLEAAQSGAAEDAQSAAANDGDDLHTETTATKVESALSAINSIVNPLSPFAAASSEAPSDAAGAPDVLMAQASSPAPSAPSPSPAPSPAPDSGGGFGAGGVLAVLGALALAGAGGGGGSSPAPAPNQAPESSNVSAEGAEDPAARIVVNLLGSDADGSVTSYVIISLPANGVLYAAATGGTPLALGDRVSVVNGVASVYFVPAANSNGQTSFQFAAVDNTGAQDATPATATITISAVNDAPTATSGSASATEDGAIATVDLATLTADIDAGTTRTYSLGAGAPAGFSINAATGIVSYDPAGDDSLAAGATATRVANYTVSDGNGGTASATVTITVTGINDAPTATAGTGAATEDGAIATVDLATLTADIDAGTTRTYSLGAGAPTGFTINAATGIVSYDPAGDDSLAAGATATRVANYTVSDGNGGEATATVTITVTGVNDAPIITNTAAVNASDQASVDENAGSLNIATASDADGDAMTLSIDSTTWTGVAADVAPDFALGATPLLTLSGGDIVFNIPASLNTLANGASRTVSINYNVTDGVATTNATVTVTITGSNDGATVSDLTANDEDIPGTFVGSFMISDVDVLSGAAVGEPNTDEALIPVLPTDGDFGLTNGDSPVNFSYSNGALDPTDFDSTTFTTQDGTMFTLSTDVVGGSREFTFMMA